MSDTDNTVDPPVDEPENDPQNVRRDGSPAAPTPPAWVDPGATKVHAPPVTKSDPVLAHLSESIEDAKKIAHKLYGDHGEAARKRKPDPKLHGVTWNPEDRRS